MRSDPHGGNRTALRRRALGALLAGLTLLPLPLLLDPAVAGPAARAVRSASAGLLVDGWIGTLAVVALAGIAARFAPRAPDARARSLADDLGRALTRLSAPRFALLCAGIVLAGSAAVGHGVLAGEPLLLDEMVQMRHARLLAEGRLAEAWPFDPAFRDTQNGVWTRHGWTSIYPPGHTALLAVGALLGAMRWVGPTLAAAGIGVWTLVLLRVLEASPVAARAGALLAAASPFVWATSAGYLSHPAAMALSAVALWCTLRGLDDRSIWGLPAGLAAGLAVLARPWTGILLALLLPAGVVLLRPGADRTRRIRVVALAVVGGLAPAVAFMSWNAHLFGAAGTLGYEAAFGPDHGLGWHRDPWGNRYGPVEALAYTAADVVQLGRALLETPLSPLLAVAAWLLAARRLPPGGSIVLAWALLPLVGHAAYWHHGTHLGPRMLAESAPGWSALTALSLAAGLGAPNRPGVRRFTAWTMVIAAAWAAAVGVPARIGGWSALPRGPEPPPGPAPALIFVHGSWASRVAGDLAATGMRRDSIETALRRNDLCRVHTYARARRAGTHPLPDLDLEPRAGTPPELRAVALSRGNRAWVDPETTPTPSCVRAARADRQGVTPLARVLAEVAPWNPRATAVWVRDLGPERNQELIAALPGRTPRVWGTTMGWMDYREAMLILWGAPEEPGRGPAGPAEGSTRAGGELEELAGVDP